MEKSAILKARETGEFRESQPWLAYLEEKLLCHKMVGTLK